MLGKGDTTLLAFSVDVTFSVCFSVLVVKGREDVTIKVSDRGGGIPRSLRDHIFEYLYTTAPNPILTNSAEITDVSSLIGGRSPKFYFPCFNLKAHYTAIKLLQQKGSWSSNEVLRACQDDSKTF